MVYIPYAGKPDVKADVRLVPGCAFCEVHCKSFNPKPPAAVIAQTQATMQQFGKALLDFDKAYVVPGPLEDWLVQMAREVRLSGQQVQGHA